MQAQEVSIKELFHALVWILVGVAIVVSVIFLWNDIKAVFTPVILSGVIAYMFYPIMLFLQNKGLPRVVSIITVYVMFIALIVVLSLFVIPLLVSEFSVLADKIPQYTAQIEQWLNSLEKGMGRFEVPPTIQEMLQQNIGRIQSFAVRIVQGSIGFLINLFSKAFIIILSPVLAFYILKDLEELQNMFKGIIPSQFRQEAYNILHRIHTVLGSWLRGQLLISLINSLMVFIGIRFIGMNFALVIAIISFITNLIPYFGPIIGAVPATLLALTNGWGMAVKVLILYTIVQQIEGNIISPQVMGKSIGLHPAIIIVALLVGGRMMGFMGLVLAVPIAGIIKAIMDYYLELRSE